MWDPGTSEVSGVTLGMWDPGTSEVSGVTLGMCDPGTSEVSVSSWVCVIQVHLRCLCHPGYV